MAKSKQVFYFEHTDLFAGECNYCFLNRFAVMANTERGAINILSRHIGLSHRFDGIKYVSRSGATAFYTVDSDMPDHAIDAFKPVNFELGVYIHYDDFPPAPQEKCYVL